MLGFIIEYSSFQICAKDLVDVKRSFNRHKGIGVFEIVFNIKNTKASLLLKRATVYLLNVMAWEYQKCNTYSCNRYEEYHLHIQHN